MPEDGVVRLAVRTLNVASAAVWRVGPDGIGTMAGRGPEGGPLPVPERLQRALGDGTPVVVPDVRKDPGIHRLVERAGFAGVRFAAFHPVRGGSGSGLLCLVDTLERDLSEEELRLFADLAGLAGGVLERRPSEPDVSPGSLAVFRELFRASGIGMALADPRGRIVEINPTVEALLGYSAAELIGMDAEGFTHPDDVGRGRPFLRDVREGRRTSARVEKRFIRRDGDVMWGRLTISVLDRSSGLEGYTLGLLEDITEQVWSRERLLRFQEELHRSKEAAEEASRNKSEFLAKMSHELRTPLNSVIGFAGVLLKAPEGLQERQRSYLERILANGHHLLHLINNILDLSKVEAGRMEVQRSAVSVGDLVRETVTEMEGQLGGAPVILAAEVPPGLAPIITDRPKLKQILINLVGNAIKFTRQGVITVRVQRSARGRPAAIEVEDTGVGIPPDRLDVIFQAFQQADNSASRRFEGSGLGLAISRSLADLLGFGLDVRSRLGSGSTFRVDLEARPDPGTGREHAA